jgi:hypothetical protein
MTPPLMEDHDTIATIRREPGAGPLHSDHAADFSWIVGQLEFLNMKNQWRVRYASYDADDKFGGVVALSGVDHVAGQLKEGMAVRLQGQLVESDSKKASPEYFVHDIRVIK